MSRADYCPIGGEPCQSLCAKQCTSQKPLTDEQIETMALQDETLRYHFALNGGAGRCRRAMMYIHPDDEPAIKALAAKLARKRAKEQK